MKPKSSSMIPQLSTIQEERDAAEAFIFERRQAGQRCVWSMRRSEEVENVRAWAERAGVAA